MEYSTFRTWLAERGCRFDTQSKERGEGHGIVTIHRAGRTTELPLVGASHNLDPSSVRQVCEALGLDWSTLPGPEGRV
jgi:mRNA interferase HicA